MKETIKLDKWEGHIILMCKNHYDVKGVDFFTGLKNLWCIRCGIPIEDKDYILEYIANAMHELIITCAPSKEKYLHQIVHKALVGKAFFTPENLSPIQSVIWEYRTQLHNLQIRDGVKNVLIELPKPQKRVIKRIVRGNGRFCDYELIK